MISVSTLKKLLWGTLLSVCILLAVLLPMRGCNFGITPTETTTTTTTDTIPGDKAPQVSETYTPQSALVVYRTITEPVDTAAILAECMAIRYYADTLRNDAELLAVVEDTVSMAGIVARKFTLQNKRPVAVISHTTTTAAGTKKLQLYGGVFGGYLVKSKRPQFGAELNLVVNGSVSIGYGYDILNNGHTGRLGLKLTGKK